MTLDEPAKRPQRIEAVNFLSEALTVPEVVEVYAPIKMRHFV